ncbi:MAG: methyltransferase [Myxococcota bacterium]
MSLSQDSLWGGRLTLWQPARGHGYRYNLDPVLLAGFAAPAFHMVDLGAGCGVLGLLLLGMGKAQRVTAVERQAQLCECAVKNAKDNGYDGVYRVVADDLRQLHEMTADAVVFNPPYYPAGSGQPSAHRGRDEGRHERHGTLKDFVVRAAALLEGTGRCSAIVPVERGAELEEQLAAVGLHVQRIRPIKPRVADPVAHVLLEAANKAQERVIEQPLIIHQGGSRQFTEEVRRWVEGPVSGS